MRQTKKRKGNEKRKNVERERLKRNGKGKEKRKRAKRE